MSHTKVKPEWVGRFALGCVAASLFCAALLVLFPGTGFLRGIAGSLGFNAGCYGIGVAIWCSLRLRERGCYLASALSVPNVVVWAWLANQLLHAAAI